MYQQPYMPMPVQKPRRPRWPWAIPLVGALALGLIVGVIFAVTRGDSQGSSGTQTPATFTMSGSITLHADGLGIEQPGYGGTCYGRGGYSDLGPGTAVTVADPQGRILATGRLNVGVPHSNFECEMPFTVGPVPEGLASYSVTVSHRGTQVILPAEAQQGVRLTIGSN